MIDFFPKKERTLYEVLDIEPAADTEIIAQAYRKKMFKLHPDRKARKGHPLTAEQEEEVLLEQNLCIQAAETLSDPVKRAMYDLETGFKDYESFEMKKLINMQRTIAHRQIDNMEHTAIISSYTENTEHGLYILRARYGLKDEFIDVTTQLQYRVHTTGDHCLVITNSNYSSYRWEEGFFDPTNSESNDKLQLEIYYTFLNKLHYCIYNDGENILLPLPDHIVENNNTIQDLDLLKYKNYGINNLTSLNKKKYSFVYSLFYLMGTVLITKNITTSLANIFSSILNKTIYSIKK